MSDTEFNLPALQALVDAAPIEQLRAAPDRYDPLDPTHEGSWRFVMESGLPTALIWTDWDKGFGVITIRSGYVANEFHDYVTTGKKLAVPAGWAYSTAELFALRFVNSPVSLSPKTEGKLAGAWAAASGTPTNKEEEPNES